MERYCTKCGIRDCQCPEYLQGEIARLNKTIESNVTRISELSRELGGQDAQIQAQSESLVMLNTRLEESKHLLMLWLHEHMADEVASDDLMMRTSKFLSQSK